MNKTLHLFRREVKNVCDNIIHHNMNIQSFLSLLMWSGIFMKFDRTYCTDELKVILTFKIKNDSTLIKWLWIFCCHYKILPRPFGISFCVILYICKLPLMHISVHTYEQCAAVRTHRSLMREPPQNPEFSTLRATCHGNWPRYAILPPVIRLACSFRGTWTFPANSATHINTFQCSNRNSM